MEISQQITKAIEQQLPKEVGDVLQARLEKLDQLEKQNEKYAKQIVQLQDKNTELHNKVRAHDDLDTRKNQVSDAEQALAEKERDFKVKEMEIKLEESEKRANLSKEFVQLIFKSPVYRKTTYKDVPVPNGGYTHSSVEDEHITED